MAIGSGGGRVIRFHMESRPLLRTMGVPLSTTAWTSLSPDEGRTWIIDYIHEPRVPAPLPHQG
ncbi:hypothetical protein ADL30_09885 [Streptomyces sp. NRRL S-1521]|nr:hypothetical protein ADL30_09885 [Streptomyces sp. NRRL S-1521]